MDISGRIAKAIAAMLYLVIFGLTELAMKIDLFLKGQISLLDAFRQTIIDLFENGIKNAPSLLYKSIELIQGQQIALGTLRLAEFFLFILFLAIILTIPGYMLGVIGTPIGFLGLLIWSAINTFILAFILNNQLPSAFGINLGWILLIIGNLGFIFGAYYFNKGNKKN